MTDTIANDLENFGVLSGQAFGGRRFVIGRSEVLELKTGTIELIAVSLFGRAVISKAREFEEGATRLDLLESSSPRR